MGRVTGTITGPLAGTVTVTGAASNMGGSVLARTVRAFVPAGSVAVNETQPPALPAMVRESPVMPVAVGLFPLRLPADDRLVAFGTERSQAEVDVAIVPDTVPVHIEEPLAGRRAENS